MSNNHRHAKPHHFSESMKRFVFKNFLGSPYLGSDQTKGLKLQAG